MNTQQNNLSKLLGLNVLAILVLGIIIVATFVLYVYRGEGDPVVIFHKVPIVIELIIELFLVCTFVHAFLKVMKK
jgi:hypothetical protein